jgi:hypothetical protein
MLLREAILDNPILVKHLRSRLRSSQVLPSIAGVVILCLFFVYFAGSTQSLGTSPAFTFFLLLQCTIAFVAGTSQVATVVAHAKDSGIIDFHRISPVRPWALVVGFVLGGAVREWLLFACTLPFALFYIFSGAVSIAGYLLILFDTIVVALLYHLMAALAGLISPKPRNVSGGVVALVFMMHSAFMVISMAVPAVPTILPTLAEVMDWNRGGLGLAAPAFYGIKMPAFFLSLMHQLPLLFFLFIAADRKMRSERAFMYSKPVALAFHAAIGFLLLGDVVGGIKVPGMDSSNVVASVIVTYGLCLAGIMLTTAITPGAGDFANGILRARKQGLPTPSPWSDLAANWAPVLGFCVVLAAAAFGAVLLTGQSWSGPVIASVMVGACVVYYFACARQAFDLMFRKNAASYMALMLFILWLMPLLIGGIALASNMDRTRTLSQTIMGLSPLAGILLAADPTGGGLSGAGGMAISSSILFCIAFTQLRLQAERRATEAALKMREF